MATLVVKHADRFAVGVPRDFGHGVWVRGLGFVDHVMDPAVAPEEVQSWVIESIVRSAPRNRLLNGQVVSLRMGSTRVTSTWG